MTRRASPLAAGVALLTWSCGVPLMTLPSGPGASTDASAALAGATGACAAVSSLSAEIAVRGSIAGRGIRARLLTGIADPDALRIEAVAPFGQPAFIVVATGGDATVVLSDDRVLEHADPDAALEALTGVPVEADDLLNVLTGCADGPDPARGRALGDGWLVVPDGTAELYLRREAASAPWRLVAAVHRSAGGAGWRAEYRDFRGGLPQSVRLASTGDNRFDLRLALTQVDLNEALGPEVFRVRVPAGAVPIGIEQLRQATWGG